MKQLETYGKTGKDTYLDNIKFLSREDAFLVIADGDIDKLRQIQERLKKEGKEEELKIIQEMINLFGQNENFETDIDVIMLTDQNFENEKCNFDVDLAVDKEFEKQGLSDYLIKYEEIYSGLIPSELLDITNGNGVKTNSFSSMKPEQNIIINTEQDIKKFVRYAFLWYLKNKKKINQTPKLFNVYSPNQLNNGANTYEIIKNEVKKCILELKSEKIKEIKKSLEIKKQLIEKIHQLNSRNNYFENKIRDSIKNDGKIDEKLFENYIEGIITVIQKSETKRIKVITEKGLETIINKANEIFQELIKKTSNGYEINFIDIKLLQKELESFTDEIIDNGNIQYYKDYNQDEIEGEYK